MGVNSRAGRANADGCRPRKRKALMLTPVPQIVGQNHYGFKFKQIIKMCSYLSRDKKSKF